MSDGLIVGVLGLQGDVEEHVAAVQNAFAEESVKGETILVKDLESLNRVSGLVIPGGESTVMGSLSSIKGIMPGLRENIGAGLPTLGTCAGMIMLARKAYDRVVQETNQSLIGALDVVVERNSFGRQKESFEAKIDLDIPGGKGFSAVFIRAPTIKLTGAGVRELGRFEESVVAVQQGNVIATAFHPELSGSPLVHQYLVSLARSYRKN
jgi:pyridoxal 5'-phosphate synthase pdxT subunit